MLLILHLPLRPFDTLRPFDKLRDRRHPSSTSSLSNTTKSGAPYTARAHQHTRDADKQITVSRLLDCGMCTWLTYRELTK